MLLSDISILFLWGALSDERKGLQFAVQSLNGLSRRTHNHTLLSHLRLPQPGGAGSRIYIPQEQGGPDLPPGIGFRLRRLLQLIGLEWRYSNPPPTWRTRSLCISLRNMMVQSRVKVTLRPTVNQYVLVPSPSGSREAAFKLNLIRHWEGYIRPKLGNVTIWRAAYEECSATWNLGRNSALGPRKIAENLGRVGWSQDLTDAN
jgi:hypothetical protein